MQESTEQVEKTAMKTYSPAQIVVAGVLGGPIASGLFFWRNFQNQFGHWPLTLGFLAVFVGCSLAFLFPSLPAIYLGPAVAGLYGGRAYNIEKEVKLTRADFPRQSWLSVILISIGIVIIVFLALLLLAMVIPVETSV